MQFKAAALAFATLAQATQYFYITDFYAAHSPVSPFVL
jgi:hypothetical protein